MKRWLTAVASVVFMVTPQLAPAQAARPRTGPASNEIIKNIFWQPNRLQQGSDAFFTVELERPAVRLSATWIGKTLSFFKTDNPKVWYALSGADVETAPGSYDLEVIATLPGGRTAHANRKIDIAAANFKVGSLDVPENFVNPDESSKKQIAADEVEKNKAYAHSAPQPLWSGNFAPPVSVKPTDSFGESHIFNEELATTHRGTDYPVPEGTPILAANAGTVVLAKEMFYEGQCVILDHGQKFQTIYMHLSKTDVNVGDKVEKGKRLGLSGATGRVTGPHVHFEVRWNGAHLDPVELVSLTLPRTRAGAAKKPAPATHRDSRRH